MKTILMLPRCQSAFASTACASDRAHVGDEVTRLPLAFPPSGFCLPPSFRDFSRRLLRVRWLLPLLLLLAQFALVPRVAAQNNNRPTGTVVSWGSQVIPEVAPGTRFTQIAAGVYHTLALKTDGTVVGWGYDGAGQTSVPAGLNEVVAISAATFHSLALKADGTVVAWSHTVGWEIGLTGLGGVVAIAAAGGYFIGDSNIGGWHSLALKADGTVVAWGNNDSGQCTVPAGLTGVIAVAGGRHHSLALKADGTVVMWGATAPAPAGLTGVVAIAAGDFHNLALRGDGTVVAWGGNDAGQSTVPEGLTGVVAIEAGLNHSLALKADGTVVAWGNNDVGQSTVPAGLTGVFALAAGGNSSLALVADAPALVLQASGDNLLLSWPLWAQGFGLQATPNLADENSWTPVLTVPVVAGSQNRVTEPIASPAKFYRLKK